MVNKKIHRDIKTSNILVTQEGNVKIADFGVCAQLNWEDDIRHSYVGTSFWMAPEILQEHPNYGLAVDIWSVGITAYELATGALPYNNMTQYEMLKNIKQNKPPQLTGTHKFQHKLFDSLIYV